MFGHVPILQLSSVHLSKLMFGILVLRKNDRRRCSVRSPRDRVQTARERFFSSLFPKACFITFIRTNGYCSTTQPAGYLILPGKPMTPVSVEGHCVKRICVVIAGEVVQTIRGWYMYSPAPYSNPASAAKPLSLIANDSKHGESASGTQS